MNKRIVKYSVGDAQSFKLKLIEYTKQLQCFCFLDNNSTKSENDFDYLLAYSPYHELIGLEQPFFELKNFIDKSQDWSFGFLTYDLKNDTEALFSNNFDLHNFPKMHFFNPEIIVQVKGQDVQFLYSLNYKENYGKSLFNSIQSIKIKKAFSKEVYLESRVSKKDYIKNINSIKAHLKKGDIYEMNYCQEFFSQNFSSDIFMLFASLNRTSQAPFSAFYRINDNFCLCASPERYLSKKGKKVFSQPIKGTIKRSSDQFIDMENKIKLVNSDKDFSENIMIVDLVRNDLSRFAKKGTVCVDELMGVYSYKDVHHLVSTISCEINDEIHIVDALKSTFPMGSMTGAPKIKAMEIIEKYEATKRGLYSGSIGYINPNGDFDFNVVIRSILYNKKSQYLSFMVGGAITIDSDPELEYEECLAKAQSIFKVLGQ